MPTYKKIDSLRITKTESVNTEIDLRATLRERDACLSRLVDTQNKIDALNAILAEAEKLGIKTKEINIKENV